VSLAGSGILILTYLRIIFFLGTGMLMWCKDGAEADLPDAKKLFSSDHKKGKMIIALNNI
jgi:hypothetical protein